jgi:hypothetical protein
MLCLPSWPNSFPTALSDCIPTWNPSTTPHAHHDHAGYSRTLRIWCTWGRWRSCQWKNYSSFTLTLPCPSAELHIELGASYLIGRCCTTRAMPPAHIVFFSRSYGNIYFSKAITNSYRIICNWHICHLTCNWMQRTSRCSFVGYVFTLILLYPHWLDKPLCTCYSDGSTNLWRVGICNILITFI